MTGARSLKLIFYFSSVLLFFPYFFVYISEALTLRGRQIPLLLECGHSICYGCAKLCPEIFCSSCGQLARADQKKSELYPLNIYALGLACVTSHRPSLLKEQDISFKQTVVPKARLLKIAGV